jgi:putative hydrolase of the HAD superfamily
MRAVTDPRAAPAPPALPRPIEAVLLDVGGVFIVPDHNEVVAGAARIGLALDPGRLEVAHYRGIAAWDRSADAATTSPGSLWRPYIAAYFEAAGVPDAHAADLIPELAEIFRSVSMWSTPLAASAAALPAVAATGVRIGIVSNADGTVEAALRSLGICQVGPGPGVEVGVILDSLVVGVEKPDPRIFALALDALGVAPEQAIHVGDSCRADVDGARAAGVTPLHFDPFATCDDQGHWHLAALADLVPLLRASREGSR